jgi:hypothetical protein
MIDFVWRKGPFKMRTRWFHDRPLLSEALGFTHYMQCPCAQAQLGFIRKSTPVKVVSLRPTDSEIFASFKSRTRNYIRQAQKAGVQFEFEDSKAHFIDFYNPFARRSGLPELSMSHYIAGEAGIVTKATLNGRDLVMHSYITDREKSCVRLAHSVGLSSDDTEMRTLIGNANRLLHYQDMLHFKSDGIEVYDFGSYSPKTNDNKTRGLNQFKDSFGGEVIEEGSYRSLPLQLALVGMSTLNRLRTAQRNAGAMKWVTSPTRRG